MKDAFRTDPHSSSKFTLARNRMLSGDRECVDKMMWLRRSLTCVAHACANVCRPPQRLTVSPLLCIVVSLFCASVVASEPESLEPSQAVQVAALTAGTSRIDLTPPPQMKASLGGYGERMSRPAEGIHDRVFAKALVVFDRANQRRFALLTADILGFPPAFKPALVKRLAADGWTSDQMMILASHSHTSIDLNAINPANVLDNKQIGLFDRALYEWTLQRCETVIRQAASNPDAVTMGTVSMELNGWNRNRRQRDGVTDKLLTLTRVDRTDGRPLAVLVNFTAHPTFMSAEHMLFSGGWPGHLQRSLERAIGDDVNVLYYNGAEGDQSPVGRPGSGNDAWLAAEEYGHSLSKHAYELWKQAKTERDLAFGFHTETIELPERSWHPDFMKTGGKEYGLSEELLQKALPVMFPAQTTSSCLRLGDLLIVGIPGEMAAQLGLDIQKQAAKQTGTPHVTIGGLADAWISYILSPEAYDRGGYEASVSFYGRTLGNRIVRGAVAAAGHMHAPQGDADP